MMSGIKFFFLEPRYDSKNRIFTAWSVSNP